MEKLIKDITLILNSKNLSKSSIDTYIKLLINLKINNLTDLNDYNNIINNLFSKYSNLSTIKTYLNAIINVNNNPKYNELRNKLQKDIDLIKGNNIKNEDKHISYDKLKHIVDFKNINDLKHYSDEMLLYFAIYYPLRLDYWNITLVSPKEKMSGGNYMIINNKNVELILNDYKTKKIYGTFINKFNKKTFEIVKKYILLFENEINHKPLKLFNFKSKATYAKHLQLLLFKRTGLHLTNNDIRSAYESSFIQSEHYTHLTNNQKEQVSRKILHSHAEALKSYNKV